MRCPMCGGDFEDLPLRTATGDTITGFRCTQCGGFWFENAPSDNLLPESVEQFDAPQPNFSLKSFNFICPIDRSVMSEDETRQSGQGRQWHCNDCGGVFFPRGQLSLSVRDQDQENIKPTRPMAARTQTTMALGLSFLLIVSTLATLNRHSLSLSALGTSPLPTSSPNILTLLLLALAYIAGTVLAVLGRRLPIIMLGWGVIVVCLVGFSVLIFGP